MKVAARLLLISFVGALSGCNQVIDEPVSPEPIIKSFWHICSDAHGYVLMNKPCTISHKTDEKQLIHSEPIPVNNASYVIADTLPTIEPLTILFDSGYSKLSRDMVGDIKSWVKLNRQLVKGKKLVVTGYTDPTGSKELNTLLAQQRAQSVSNLLVQMGLPKKQLTIKTVPDCCRAGTESIEFARQRKTTVEIKE